MDDQDPEEKKSKVPKILRRKSTKKVQDLTPKAKAEGNKINKQITRRDTTPRTRSKPTTPPAPPK